MKTVIVVQTLRTRITTGMLFIFCLGFVASSINGQEDSSSASNESTECSIDLTLPGMMKDVVSNALISGLKHRESDVQTFLKDAETRYATGQELLEATAVNFKVDKNKLTAEVERFKHCNCVHGSVDDDPIDHKPIDHKPIDHKPIDHKPSDHKPSDHKPSDHKPRQHNSEASKFAQDVTLHVALHELGHALIREFDLPILGNEECMADAFATHYLTTHLPDRAVDVLTARTQSLMIEAAEVPRAEWGVSGEHNNDARRAHQIAALAVAANPEKYTSVATAIGMSDEDIKSSRDYGTEIHRSWRRVLQPLWMPEGVASNEVRFKYDPESKLISQLHSNGMTKEIESIVKRFDWHSQITIYFAHGDGGASWSRSKRTITIHSEYINRFIKQCALQQQTDTLQQSSDVRR